MKACGSCGAWIPDDAMSCPNCARAVGGAPASSPPVPPASGPPAAPGPSDDGSADHFRRRAEDHLRLLGTLYMVAGFMALGFVALSFFQNATGATARSFDDLRKTPGPLDPEMLRTISDLFLQPWYLAVSHAVPFLFGVLWVWSGSRLRNIEGRGTALVAAALLCIPCAGCCCLNLPLGIYALVTLTRADSEAAFAR